MDSTDVPRRRRVVLLTFMILAVLLWAAERWLSANWLMAFVTGFPHQPLLLVALGLAVYVRRGPPLYLALGLLLWTLIVLCSFNIPLSRASSGGKPLTVLSYNVQSAGLGTSAVADVIQRSGADLVFLQECEDAIVPQLCPAGWHSVAGGDLAIVSRFPLSDRAVVNLAEGFGWRPMLSARMDWDGRAVNVYDIHFIVLYFGLNILTQGTRMPAVMNQAIASRQAQADSLLRHLTDGPTIVAGDLNAPPRDAAVQTVHSRLRDAFDAAGWGFGSTFSATTPIVRIDYILTSADFAASSCEVLPDIASDHRALRAVLEGESRTAFNGAPPAAPAK